jgi:L-iditol 2-dehydrogenase
MKTLRLHGKRDLRLHDEPPPTPDSGELLLRVNAVGLCGSDLHWFLEGGIGDATLTRPLILGHEFVGTVASGPRAGERVAVDPAIPCGRCATCLAGDQNLCVKGRFAGHGGTDGALRTLMTWPEELVCPLPDSLSDKEGALLEPLGVALHALDLSRVGPGATAAVCGCGPIGLLLVQLLRMIGATTIVATDLLPHRVAAAEAMGATHAIETGAVTAGPDLAERTPGGYGVDAAFEAAGDDSALQQALSVVRPGGRLVVIGIPAGDQMCLTASTARRKGLTILLCRRMKHTDLQRALKLAERGYVALRPLVSEQHGLLDSQTAFDALATRRGLKVVVEP